MFASVKPMTLGVAVVGAVLAYGVWAQITAPKALIIDGWWQRDHAKVACRSRYGENSGLCSDDAIGQKEYTYSGQLMAELLANKDCSGIVVHYFSSPSKPDPDNQRLSAGPHITLMVDYDTYGNDQPWSLAGHHQSGTAYQAGVGKGNIEEVAQKVCAIVSNPGAWKD
jgi:hypothetical protein